MALDISTARSDIAKIYIAAFNRVPDSDGLNFWVNAYLNGASLTSIASGFATSTEYATKYPSYQTNTEYVAAVYQNVFGRAVDTGGSKFWTDALDAGTLTKAGLLNSLVSAAAANGSTDGARLTNQAEFGVYCASNNIQWTNATTALSAITSDTATVTTAKTTVSTNEANTSHILTTGQDTPIGTSGNDEFRAVAGATIGTQDQTTLNSSDVIDGGAGTDTLIVNMTGATYSGGARIKNIETLKIGTNLPAATFDYNVNQGSNEITEVTKVVADQINTGETLTVNNVLKTSGVLPTLAWENDSNTANAGTVNYGYRATELTGTADNDNQAVNLSKVTNGVLNLAAGIETVTLTSGISNGVTNTERVTLNSSTNTDTTGTGTPYNNVADIVSNGTLTKVVLAGTAEIGKAADRVSTTGLTDRTTGVDTGSGASTQSNLLSVESRVTEVYASAATAATNVRFVNKSDNSAQNVTFKGGAGNDYVEFELGDITATGGTGNDTFAFITTAAAVTNSTFGAADNITGGTGTDTIQIGVNGTGTYNVALSEFANKSGIDTLDLRGASNTVTLSSSFVSASDAGLTVTTDAVVVGGTAPSDVEAGMTTVLDLTNLSAGQGITFTGGQGSDRVVLNDATFTNAMKLNAGSHTTGAGVAASGDYDTLTFVNSGVMDRNDLANISGFEGLNLVENVTGNTSVRIELTEAFLLANTAASNSTATSTDDSVFKISSVAAANGTALGATDTVVIDISDLLTSTGALKTSLTGRGIDVSGAASVSYVVNGAAATATQISNVTKPDTTRADVTGSAAGAANGNTLVSSAAAFNTTTGVNITGTLTSTVNNDIINVTSTHLAGSTIAASTGTDILNVTGGSLGTALAAATTGLESVTVSGNSTGIELDVASFGAGNITSVSGDTGTAQILALDGGSLNFVTSGVTISGIEQVMIDVNNGTADTVTMLDTNGITTFSGSAVANDNVTFTSTTALDLTAVTLTNIATVTVAGSATITGTQAASATNFTGATGSTLTINQTGAVNLTAAGGAITGFSTVVAGSAVTNLTLGDNDTVAKWTMNALANTVTVNATTTAREIDLSSGGADKVVINNAVHNTTVVDLLTISGFTTTAGTNLDQMVVQLNGTAFTPVSYTTLTAATNGAVENKIVELDATAFLVSGASFSAADGGNVELAIAAAVGTGGFTAADDAYVIVYGTGALSSQAALVYIASAAAVASDAATGDFTTEVVAVLTGITAGSLGMEHFAAA